MGETVETISLAVPVHDFENRQPYVMDLIHYADSDDRISEVVLSFEPHFERPPLRGRKVRCFYNEKREYVFRNKFLAVDRCANNWVIVFDSDNKLDKAYVDKLFEYYPWNNKMIYQPDFAEPNFNITCFDGKVINRSNAAECMKTPIFRTIVNAMNYFVNRQAFLEANREMFNSGYDPKCSDSIQINYNMLTTGNSMLIVPGLRYKHTVHPGSYYRQSMHQYNHLILEMELKVRQLK